MTTNKTEGALPEFPSGADCVYDYNVDWSMVREESPDTPTYSIEGTVELYEEDSAETKKVGNIAAFWMPMAGWHCQCGDGELLVDHCDAFNDGLVRMARPVAQMLSRTHGWLALHTMVLDPIIRGKMISYHLLGELLEMVSHGPVIVSCEAASVEKVPSPGAEGKLLDHWQLFGFRIPLNRQPGKPTAPWNSDPKVLAHDTELLWPEGSYQRAVTHDGVQEALVMTALRGLEREGKLPSADGDIDELPGTLSLLTSRTRSTKTMLFKNGTLGKVVEEGEAEE